MVNAVLLVCTAVVLVVIGGDPVDFGWNVAVEVPDFVDP